MSVDQPVSQKKRLFHGLRQPKRPSPLLALGLDLLNSFAIALLFAALEKTSGDIATLRNNSAPTLDAYELFAVWFAIVLWCAEVVLIGANIMVIRQRMIDRFQLHRNRTMKYRLR
ncbi:MAG TPA: hypothetical protein VD907_01375 [Verrucomicrobiae bacterium]|nr:hypothetical protein [Verrucomicrobiae bacterium]